MTPGIAFEALILLWYWK